eukprot:4873941-Pyramimonas_sp.AAC.1
MSTGGCPKAWRLPPLPRLVATNSALHHPPQTGANEDPDKEQGHQPTLRKETADFDPPPSTAPPPAIRQLFDDRFAIVRKEIADGFCAIGR